MKMRANSFASRIVAAAARPARPWLHVNASPRVARFLNEAGARRGKVLLPSANMHDVDLRGADLRGLTLADEVRLAGHEDRFGAILAEGRVVSLSHANLTEAVLVGANLAGADLSHANLTQAVLASANLAGADLSHANLGGADLGGADLHYAILVGANLYYAKLTGMDLTGANLTGANLAGADLARMDLTGANLTGANLTGADLIDANLAGANLASMDLAGANLTGANLTGADLTGANLTGANLTDADLAGARLGGVILADAYLTGMLWSAHTKWPTRGMAEFIKARSEELRPGVWRVAGAGSADAEIDVPLTPVE